MVLFFLFYIAFLVFILAAFWKTFEKGNEPGWASLIPIYSFYVLARIAGVKNWWLIFIPLANIYIFFVVMIALAKAFGKDAGFGIGLALLGCIFFPILGFGSAVYIGPNGVNQLQADINTIGSNQS